jgi:hypothetical protein
MNIGDETSNESFIEKTKVTLAICAPLPEDSLVENNNWMTKTSSKSDIASISNIENKGVNMIGLNFFSFGKNNTLDVGLFNYLENDSKFGVYSFWMKPANMLYNPIITDSVVKNENDKIGSGDPSSKIK